MKHQIQFLRRHNIRVRNLTIQEIASIGNITRSDAEEIYKRGIINGQCGYLRLYMFLNKLDNIRLNKQKKMNKDFDIAQKYIMANL